MFGDGSQIFVASSAVSPLYGPAAQAAHRFIEKHASVGLTGIVEEVPTIAEAVELTARYLGAAQDEVALVRNTTEAISLVANGLELEPGDEIVTFAHEYPANYHPWIRQQERGAIVRTLPSRGGPRARNGKELPRSWSMEDLAAAVSSKTRVLALSHVQFHSGVAFDLNVVGRFCKERGIAFVVDVAQSLGCMPLDVAVPGLSALAAPACKWLCGPLGVGILYARRDFADSLSLASAGVESMTQGWDLEDMRWSPHKGARKFMYSTSAMAEVAALRCVMEEVFLKNPPSEVWRRVLHLQDRLKRNLVHERLRFLEYAADERSGILSAVVDGDENKVVSKALEGGVVLTARCGYLRFAPHFYCTDAQIDRVSEVVIGALSGL